MSKEKEMLKTILANTNAIMNHLKISKKEEKGAEKTTKMPTATKSKTSPQKKSK